MRAPISAMKFDLTVNLGALIATVMFFLTIFTMYTRLIGRLVSLDTKVEAMWEWWKANMGLQGVQGIQGIQGVQGPKGESGGH